MKKNNYNRRYLSGLIALLLPMLIFAQSQYDYMDDRAVAGGADKALNGIIIILVLVGVAIVLLFVISGVLNVYYWFNPKAAPSYKRAIAKQEQERMHEKYVQEQRKNASPNAIDLGLSVKWASFNLGAYSPTDVGSFFYWAENQPSTVGHPKYSKVKVDVIGDIAGCEKYDAATKMLGKNWRLPTNEECQELLNKCKWETKIIDNIEGRLVTGANGNSIFLPFNQKNFTTKTYDGGHYWTSTPRHGSECAYDLRFGEGYKQLAQIRCAVAFGCLFCIRPVFTDVSREMYEKQKETETKKTYAQIETNNSCLSDTNIDYKYYREQCIIREEEKKQNGIPLFSGNSFAEEKIQKDDYGVIYSLDGKRLLDGSICDCRVYRIKEGTEFICDDAFSTGIFTGYLNKRMKKTLEKIILPSTLIYFPTSAIPEDCTIESLSPNYSIIGELLIDIRKKCVVKCLNPYIQKVEIYKPIEEIGNYAFINCRVLHEVILPNSIRIIGKNAFRNCEILKIINLPDSIDTISEGAFFNCEALHINHLPKNLSIIGDSAFQWCIIDGVTIPKYIKEIGKYPFSKNAKNIISDSSRFIIENSLLIDIDNNELIQLVNSTIKQVSIPGRITKIRERAFIHTDIESIIIPSTVKELGHALFWNCKYLTQVQINCKIEQLPSSIFACCSSLTSFNVPECIQVIGLEAFYRCTNLNEITFPQGLRVIEKRAFQECVNLVSINIPESIEKIGDEYEYIFKDCQNIKDVFYDAREAEITGLPHCMSNLTIGNHVKKLPKSFLIKNPVLETLIIPENVERIEKGCITDCSNLKEISILSKNIVIEEGWIRNCKNIRTIRIHVNVHERIYPLMPKEQNIKVKKIYDHQFLFFKW